MNTQKINTQNKFYFPALGLLLLLGFIWGSGYSIARYVMTHGVSPIGYSFWQCLGPAILLGLLSARNIVYDVRHIKFYFLCGLIGIAIPNTNMYYLSSHLPAGLLAVIVNTVPVIIYPMALLTKQEKFSFLRFLGVCSAIAGILCLLIPKAQLQNITGHHYYILWILTALITPFCFAFFTLFINPHRPKDSTPLMLAAGMLMAAAVLLMPWVIKTGGFYAFSGNIINNGLILLEIALSSIGYVLFFKLLKIAGPVYYSFVDGVVALTGLFWGFVLFQETPSLLSVIAISFILFGIMLVNLKFFKPRP